MSLQCTKDVHLFYLLYLNVFASIKYVNVLVYFCLVSELYCCCCNAVNVFGMIKGFILLKSVFVFTC